MRKLTQKEIDDAPNWAVSYNIDLNQVNAGPVVSYYERHYGFTLPLPHATPQSKELDIEPYKHWCDPVNDNGGPLDYCYYDEIGRDKAIEIAKHFKLIPEDSK
jgi:hypothetical protein